ERGHAFDRAAWSVAGEIWIEQLFEAERADEGRIVRAAESRGPFGRRVARGADGTIIVIVKAFAVVAGVADFDYFPIVLVVFDRILPFHHAFFPSGCGVAKALFKVAHLAEEVGSFLLLGGRVSDNRGLVIVVQEGEHFVILFLRDWIEFVRMAL